MTLADLDEREREVARYCLQCVAAGDVIVHDFEFETIMGVGVDSLQSLLIEWPPVDESQDSVRLAINNSFANLLGYPHAFQSDWDARYTVFKREVARVFAKWRGGAPESYFDGIE